MLTLSSLLLAYALMTIKKTTNHSPSVSSGSYHHGDLRQTLLDAAQHLIAQHGIEGLSLRKLAEQAGVSRTAPYHYFKDKQDLLGAIAAQAFAQRAQQATQRFADPRLSAAQCFRAFFMDYIEFATQSPAMYELMFGSTLWRGASPSEELKQQAYPCFQQQLAMIRQWQQQGLLPTQQDPLRLAQITWATLHGIARLVNDGVYADSQHISAMVDCAVALFLGHGNNSTPITP